MRLPAAPRDLLADAAAIFSTQVVALGLQFGTGILLARMLGPSGRGTYAVLTLVPATAVALGGIGMGSVITHWAARGLAAAPTLFGNILLLAAVLGLGYGAGLYLLLDPTWTWLRGADPSLLALMCGVVPVLLFNDYALALLLGTGRVAVRNLAKVLEAGTMFALIVLLALGGAGGMAQAAWAWAASGVVVAAVAFQACRRVAGRRPEVSLAALKPALAKGLQGALGPACTFLLLRSDLYLVSHFLGSQSAGHYAVSASLANVVLLLPMSVGSAFLPRVSRIQGPAARQLSAAVCRLTNAMTLAVCAALALLAGPLVGFLYGAEFAPAVEPLLWLLPGVAAAAVGLVLGADLQGSGNFHVGSFATGLAVVVNVCANLVVIPRWGLVGAAISSTVAYTLAGGIVLAAYARGGLLRWHEPLRLPRLSDLRRLRAASATDAA